jgi:hypothetical protein
VTLENLIIIKGGSYSDIKKALRQWMALYAEDLDNDVVFKLYKNGKGNHILKADERLDNDRFFYLVNYLNYPEGINYKVDIEGYTTGKELKEILNKKLLVYISSNDKGGDNVYAVTSDSKNYKIDFSGRITPSNVPKFYRHPDLGNLENAEIVRLDKREIENQRAERADIKWRFRIISSIALACIVMSPIALFIDPQTFTKATFFIGLGIGVWFFVDYEMLREEDFYFKCAMIAIAFLGYVLILNAVLGFEKTELLDFGALYPLTLLIVQKPLRKLHIKVFKIEPVVDQHGTARDFLYTLLLFLGVAVLPFLIMDLLK